MQILNISVDNRPSKSVTSGSYATYSVASVIAGVSVSDVFTRPDPLMVPVLSYNTEFVQASCHVMDVLYSKPPKLKFDINLEAALVVEDVLYRQTNKLSVMENLDATLVPHDVVSRPLIKYSTIQKLEAELIVHDVVKGA